MLKRVRIGIVGCGNVLQHQYMRAIGDLRRRGLAEATMACDIRESARQVMADEFGIINFVTEFDAVATSRDVDLVLVTTSMQEHSAVVKAGLRAGKHVLVEKPMALTLDDAAELVELARVGPGFLACAPFVILSRTHQSILRHLRAGDIGEVHLARGFYGHSGPTWGPGFYLPGGGPLLDLGVYNLTSLTSWLGPVKRVMAMAGIAIPERVVDGAPMRVETEDCYQLLLDFGDACYASLGTGFTIRRRRAPCLELYGSKGVVQMLGNDWGPDGFELWTEQSGAWQVYEKLDQDWHWTEGLRYLVKCIQQGSRPVVTPEHAYHVLEIMIRAAEAIRQGRTLEVRSTFPPPELLPPDDTGPVRL